ncbi:hypothetical protein DSCO28_15250 [Desulfosarcina ovata subsp. sediminis]|uniref:Uncharacterized protein n=1 Tax=Desulfosarcina ovata subsp. sediminis TaxID=885957 RepID=A0A5K7ZN14_9BACT|nr:hypothetical protein DSCO28_15250 [Desulfosarcina ovata subsp. sediminis]
MAPCLSLILLFVRGMPTSLMQPVLGMSSADLIEHITRFSLSGLIAISEDYKISQKT